MLLLHYIIERAQLELCTILILNCIQQERDCAGLALPLLCLDCGLFGLCLALFAFDMVPWSTVEHLAAVCCNSTAECCQWLHC